MIYLLDKFGVTFVELNAQLELDLSNFHNKKAKGICNNNVIYSMLLQSVADYIFKAGTGSRTNISIVFKRCTFLLCMCIINKQYLFYVVWFDCNRLALFDSTGLLVS